MKATMQKEYEVMQVTVGDKTFKGLRVVGTLDGVSSLEDQCGRKIIVFDTANPISQSMRILLDPETPRGMVLVAADPFFLEQVQGYQRKGETHE